MKKLGVNVVLATNASGSLNEEIRPGSFVFFDDYIDRTNKRQTTFYDGLVGHPRGVCHIPMYPAFSESLRKILAESAQDLGLEYHNKGTIVCIEGPHYSSRAESNAYQLLNASIINMTICPEVMLAKELGILYAGVALVTDYDCWKDNDKHVSVDLVAQTMVVNSEKSIKLFVRTIEKIKESSVLLLDDIRAAKIVARNSVMIDPKEVLEHLL
uniref:Nucleoside phosphorylase domain-containing protein n=1 Tax=Acrobeloides nanus TaxID=290746 RepID=A0A914ECJ4_9BILA